MKIAAARKYALSLPEATEAPHFNFSSYRVRGKIFATVPPDETHLHLFVDEEAREEALALYPDYLEKLHWGARVIGLRAQLAAADPAVIKALLGKAWTHKAPKALK